VIRSFGLGWGAVRHVILTHYHFDHVGSLGEILDQAADATVYAGAPDIERISVPRDISPVGDRDEVFGLQIVSTPGHTDGHISVFDPLGSAVFIGDAAFNFGGSLSGSIPAFTADIAQANQSLKKLGAMSFERGLFAHGPPIPSGASAAIANLAATLDGGITQSKFAGQRTRNDSPLVSGRRPEQECCG
jgi:glyoxylase-like metal-dependent hydrolase (beta-lactamase superfamily II)